MATATIETRLHRLWETPNGLYGFLASTDHKAVGRRYLVTAFVFLAAGGVEAMVMRAQLIKPANHLLSPEAYNQLFTMHGMTMIFWYASPILSGISNYFFPLWIGARDFAFPRLNMFSYWTYLMSGVVLYTGYIAGVAPDRGWFNYTPLAGPLYSPGLNENFYCIALLLLTVSTTVGAINFIVTAFKLRAPGMSVGRMPLALYGTLTASFANVFALPSLSVSLTYLYLEHRFGLHFFDVAAGGRPLLWQHLFWIFAHPWVYIIILPALSFVSMIVPTFSRRPIIGYTWNALGVVATGVLGFGVWVHHMFATGLPPMAMSFFMAGSMAVVLPSAISIFVWLVTIWHGRPVMSTAMLFVFGFIFLFVIGGVDGVFTGSIPADWQVTDTYFVVSHIHYVLIGINVFPILAAFYYWLPKITGRLMSERLGKWNFWVMFIGMNVAFFPMHNLGLLGMPRRIYTYQAGLGWTATNVVVSIGAYVFALGVLLFVLNFFWSLIDGPVAGPNPWDSASLEWATSSPPPPYNFAVIPTVRSRDPLWEERLGLGKRSEVFEGPVISDEEKVTMGTTPLDGMPQQVMRFPEDSVYPFLTALSLAAICYGLILGLWGLALGGAVFAFFFVTGWLWYAPQPVEV
ncbi:MAG TPA: cytochrome c oxidase subunit I [Gemmatimonadaceae bacterium]|nr:cytochrome c oxidase subunit I [Gemmatimonadaceae bacterium]